MLQKVEDATAIGEAQHGTHRLDGHLALSHGNGLIEQRKTIAHRTFRRARNDRHSIIRRLCALVSDDHLEVCCELWHIDPAQVEALTAR